MTEFSIYQINTDRDNNRICFLGLDSLERFQHSKEVDPALYDRTYDGKLDCSSLETIYEKFNIDHPADYKGRSLSVSDVVEIRESDTLNPGFYFVDSIGFKSISFDKSLCKEPVKASDGKISVLLVEPNKYPKMIEIDDTLEAMQEVVGGDIEEYMPFEDEVAIICNEEGKVNGLTPNRAVYGEPQAVEMTFAEMRSRFCEAENEGKEHLSGYIVFTQDSFDKPYDERSRTYGVSSNNKAFQSGMGGYSIFGSCLDGTDPCVRLDGYMFGENAWKIEKCYMMEPSREMLDIICGKFFIAYAPFDAERFQSLPPDLAEKYREKLGFYACTVASFEQYTLAKFITSGGFERHISRMKRQYKTLRNDLISLIMSSPIADRAEIIEPDSGLHFLLKIKTDISDKRLTEECAARGVRISFLSQYYRGPSQAEHMALINYSGVSREKFAFVLKILDDCLANESDI